MTCFYTKCVQVLNSCSGIGGKNTFNVNFALLKKSHFIMFVKEKNSRGMFVREQKQGWMEKDSLRNG